MGSPEPAVAAPHGWAGAEAAVTLEGSSKTQLLFRPPGARCGVWHHTPWWHCKDPASVFDLMAVTSLLPFWLCRLITLVLTSNCPSHGCAVPCRSLSSPAGAFGRSAFTGYLPRSSQLQVCI